MVSYIQKRVYDTAEFDGELIILNTVDFTVTKLNESGGICWSLLREAQTAESLSVAIEGLYRADAQTVKTDVESFLAKLMDYGLIRHAV